MFLETNDCDSFQQPKVAAHKQESCTCSGIAVRHDIQFDDFFHSFPSGPQLGTNKILAVWTQRLHVDCDVHRRSSIPCFVPLFALLIYLRGKRIYFLLMEKKVAALFKTARLYVRGNRLDELPDTTGTLRWNCTKGLVERCSVGNQRKPQVVQIWQ